MIPSKGLFLVLAALPLPLAAQTTIQNTTYTSGQNVTVDGVDTIAAHTNVTAQSGATVHYRSNLAVTLGPGFTAQVGSTFRASSGATHVLTVVDGSGDGTYPAHTPVLIIAAAAPPGQTFSGWVLEAGGGSFANPASPETVFTTGPGPNWIRAFYIIDSTDSDGDGIPDAIETVLGTQLNSVRQNDDNQNQNRLNIHRPN